MRSSTLSKALAAIMLGIGLGVSTPSLAESPPTTRQWLDVELGQSNIQASPRPFHRVLISDPGIAEIKLLEEGQFQIRGLSIGTTDLWVWYRDDPEHPQVIELTVHRDLSDLIRRVGELVPDGAPPRVYPIEDRLVLEGAVPDLETLESISAVARIFDEDFVNLMSVKGDHQVQLEVTFAEVSRTAEREMGINILYGGADVNGNRVSSGYLPLGYDSNGNALVDSAGNPVAAVNGIGGIVRNANLDGSAMSLLGVLGDPINVAASIDVLEASGVVNTLAEPTLVALSGQKAEFLSGGQVPVPVATNNQIKVEFKDYGVKLAFIPTVLAREVIDVQVQIEVSEIDASNGITINYVELPGFAVSKSISHVRLNDGMTFAMAGLLTESSDYRRSQVPLLGDIPILGALFSYTRLEREETELMIFVTPRLVRPLAADDVPPMPTATEDNNPNDFELFWMGMDHRAGSRTSDPSGPVGADR